MNASEIAMDLLARLAVNIGNARALGDEAVAEADRASVVLARTSLRMNRVLVRRILEKHPEHAPLAGDFEVKSDFEAEEGQAV